MVIGLAKLPQEVVKKLPPTDSRHRTDLYLVEQGRWAEVSRGSDSIFPGAISQACKLPIVCDSYGEPQAGRAQ